MTKTQALKLVGKSTVLAKTEDKDLSYDYYTWLSFVDEYKDVTYKSQLLQLQQLIEAYSGTH